MVLNRFRHKFAGLLSGPVDFFVKYNISPNTISFIGFLLSVLASVLLALDMLHMFWLGFTVPMTMLASGAFDVFDGAVARETGSTSKFGGFLDSTLDRYSDAILFLGMIVGGYCSILVGFLALASSLLISYIRSRAENEGVDMKGVGFLERAERFFLIMGACWAEVYLWGFTEGQYKDLTPASWTYCNFFEIFMIVLVILMNVTIVQRTVHAYRVLKGEAAGETIVSADEVGNAGGDNSGGGSIQPGKDLPAPQGGRK
ncbi:MAG: CDP-alcohol phosphatidyltransferase family protein [Promethearchaeota archaeon]